MPGWIVTFGKWLMPLILKELAAAFKNYLKRKNEERKTIKELKHKIKGLKDAETQEEIRAAIRNLNI